MVRDGDWLHFFEKSSRGYADKSGWDLQKVDLGIALCHFALAAEALGRRVSFSLEAPALPLPNGIRYIASYLLS